MDSLTQSFTILSNSARFVLQIFYMIRKWVRLDGAGGRRVRERYGGINVGTAFVIWLGQHAHHRQEYLFHTLHGTPTFRTAFIHIGIVAGRMEDADADSSIGVYIWMEHFTRKSHAGRAEGIIPGKGDGGRKQSTLVRRARRSSTQQVSELGYVPLGGLLDKCFPHEKVVLTNGPGADSIGSVQGQIYRGIGP